MTGHACWWGVDGRPFYVDDKRGSDGNPGTFDEPLRTMRRANELATKPGDFIMCNAVSPSAKVSVGAVGKPPEHYMSNGLQPFDIIDAFGLDYYEGNALKYLLRWRKKGGVEDLKKARHFIDELIERAK